MKLNITGNNLDLTPSLKKHIEKGMASLEKLLGKYDEATVKADVVVARSTKHHVQGNVYESEIRLNVPKKSFISKAGGSDVRAIFDKAKDKLKREVSDYKGKLQSKRGE